jgi:hypothetical protein
VNSTYHGLSTRLEKRFAKGLSFLGVYTFGRALDTQSNIDLCQDCVSSSGAASIQDTRNRRLNYGLADHHIAHRFVFSGNYELPFRAPGLGGHLVRGWAISGISTIQTGQPITATLNFDNSNTGTTNWPNRIGSGVPANRSINNWVDAAAFTFPAAYTFGNAGRNTLIGPGFASTDVSLARNFGLPINERSRLEFRAETFNLLNTPQFGNPNVTLGNTAFGTIGGTARSNRQMQLGMKILF